MSYDPATVKSLKALVNFLRGHTQHYCPIVSSKQIKKTIVQRCDDLGVSLAEVCARGEINYKVIKKYYIDLEEPLSRPNLRSTDLEKIGSIIGLKIRITVVMAKKESVDRKDILKIGYVRG